ncbi:MAG: ABC transporter permease [Lachnospiraceae bacterium]|jgi:ABC-type transport system involved in multi-copper enzyme maturation permease subunit|nr:ABC transporter permease [Lachnospiraceae bacterium]MEE3461099.1 ABC transporter permease [Lachnospiraceae bacterium]
MNHINPILAKNLLIRTRSVKFAISIAAFDIILMLVSVFGYRISFNYNINDYIDFSSATDIYMLSSLLLLFMMIMIIPSISCVGIAGERERASFDLLLSTGISPFRIIAGSFLESMIIIMIYAFSALPVLSIVFTVGGINLYNMAGLMLEIFLSAFFLVSFSVLASSLTGKIFRSTLISYIFIILTAVFTVVIPFIIYVMVRYLGSSINTGEDLSWISYIFMLNPFMDIGIMLSHQFGDISYISALVSKFGIGSSMIDNWELLSGGLRILFSVIFLLISSHVIDPVRKLI